MNLATSSDWQDPTIHVPGLTYLAMENGHIGYARYRQPEGFGIPQKLNSGMVPKVLIAVI